MRRIVPVSWVCGDAEPPRQDDRTGLDKTDVPARYLPLNCRASARRVAAAAVIEFDASGLDQRQPARGRQGAAVAGLDRCAQPHAALGRRVRDGGRRPGAGLGGDLAPALAAELDPPLWTLGHIAWFQEYWIARNVQRARGERADPTPPRLASILPDADAWYDPAPVDRPQPPRARGERAARSAATRAYLVETLETTLELLAGIADEDDASLYFHRLALFHEEMHARGVRRARADARHRDRPGGAHRDAGGAAAAAVSRRRAGCSAAAAPGFRFDNEAEPHPVEVPEFEIDAQAVTWAQYGEFVEDGGYDERAHWSEAGWDWLQREGRRTPRHVDQMRHGVLQRRFGVLARVAAAHPAVHVSWYEADAWCRWAGRRLPSEVEWEAAAHQGATRGFRWGDVHEWTASTFRPYPGFVPGPVARLFAARLRRAQGAARRIVRDPAGAAQRAPARLRAARARRRLLRLSQLRRLRAPSSRGGTGRIRESPSLRCPCAANNGSNNSSRRRPFLATAPRSLGDRRGHSHFPHRQRQGRDADRRFAHAARAVPARAASAHRHPRRLRHRAVRRLHRAHERARDQVVLDARRAGAGQRRSRPSRAWPRTATCIRCRRRSASATACSAASARRAW